MYSIPNNYAEAYQKLLELHVDTQLEFMKYLNMTSAFNDEIYSMKSPD